MSLWGKKPEEVEPERPVEPSPLERRLSYERRIGNVPVPMDDDHRVAERREAAKAAREKRHRVITRVTHAVDYAFALIYGLVAIQFGLGLLAANPEAGFVRFMVRLTDPLFGAFSGIVERPPLEGGGLIDFPLIVALLVYALLHLAVRGLLRVLTGQSPVKTPSW